MSNHFQSFLTKDGIIHRKSCPYTSQQNGIAERKLRHILETGLTLLAHCHLSNRYWVDAFITAVHIINRLPTPTLQHLSPFFKLYNREPNYQELRVFGCLCYPLLRPYGLHKLEYRSKPCIFLGYHHAGYKCLDPVTNKVYLSRHVVFNEASFPAKDQAVSLLPSKVSAQGDVPFILPVQFSPLHLPHTSASHPTNPPPASPGYSPSSPSSNPEPLSPEFPSSTTFTLPLCAGYTRLSMALNKPHGLGSPGSPPSYLILASLPRWLTHPYLFSAQDKFRSSFWCMWMTSSSRALIPLLSQL
jgi:hypothetical protein